MERLMDIKPTRLIQWLKRPMGIVSAPMEVQSGFTREGAQALGQIWQFDYMGSSEFGHGAVARALKKTMQHEAMVADTHTVAFEPTTLDIGHLGDHYHGLGEAEKAERESEWETKRRPH